MLNHALFYLQTSPAFFLSMIALLGLCIGSFINVAIYRIPIMLEREFDQHLAEATNQPAPQHEAFDLFFPRSHCTHCKTPIAWWANIPVLSYLFLLGKSHCCEQAIPTRYPLTELLCMALFTYTAVHFGFHWQTLAALTLCSGLMTLLFIDIDKFLLPDDITLPLLWVGLYVNLFGVFTTLNDAVVGAMVGYGLFWSVGWLFKRFRGIEGLGQGDYKLLATLGAWLGWQQIPFIILASSFFGVLYGGTRLLLGQQKNHDPIPFGPFLAVAGMIALFWGQDLLNFWYQWHGVHLTHCNEAILC